MGSLTTVTFIDVSRHISGHMDMGRHLFGANEASWRTEIGTTA